MMETVISGVRGVLPQFRRILDETEAAIDKIMPRPTPLIDDTAEDAPVADGQASA